MAFPFQNIFGKDESANFQGMPGSGGEAPPPQHQSGMPQAPLTGRQEDSSGPQSSPVSPFQPLSGGETLRPFTFDAGELARAIPPIFLCTAAPPEQRVTLNLPPSAEDKEEGAVVTNLSRIYKACPHLFAQPISAANDMEVTLPLPGSRNWGANGNRQREEAWNQAAPENPFRVVQGTPVSAVQSQAEPPQPSQPPQNNPFQVVSPPGHPESGPRSPFSTFNDPSPDQGSGNPFNLVSPPQANPAPQGDSNLFKVVSPAQGSQGPPSGSGPGDAVDTGGPDENKRLVFPLRTLLFGVDPQRLQMNPAMVPLYAAVYLPLTLLKPQLASGRVTVTVRDLLEGADETARPTLEHLDPEMPVPVPLKDIFHQLPEEEPAQPSVPESRSESQSEQAAEFETPFSRPMEEDANRIPPPPPWLTNQQPPAQPQAQPQQSEEQPQQNHQQNNPQQAGPPNPSPQSQAGAPSQGTPQSHAPNQPQPQPEARPTSFQVKPHPASGPVVPPWLSGSSGENKQDSSSPPPPPQPESQQKNPGSPPKPPENQAQGSPAQKTDLSHMGFNLPTSGIPKSPPKKSQFASLDDLGPEVEAKRSSNRPASPGKEPKSEPPKHEARKENDDSERDDGDKHDLWATKPAQPKPPREEPRHEENRGEGGRLQMGGHTLAGLNFDGSIRDVELRAIFGTAETFTLERALQRTSELPGLSGCVLFSQEGKTEGSHISNGSELKDVAGHAPSIFRRIRGVAKEIGFSDVEMFTLQMEDGAVSFFSEGDVCLSVMHHRPEFDPGVREKLVLAARGMAKLRD